MSDRKKRKPGRPPVKKMPERIPETPENVAKALRETPPKKNSGWKYLQVEVEG